MVVEDGEQLQQHQEEEEEEDGEGVEAKGLGDGYEAR